VAACAINLFLGLSLVDDFVNRAVAYLKPIASAPEGSPAGAAVGTDKADSPVLNGFGNELAIAYVVDEPQGLSYVQYRHLAEQKIELSELHRIGLANLQKLCDAHLSVRKHGPIYGIFLDGNFEASLFLLEDLWQKELAHLVAESFTIALPARDVLAFCDSASDEGVAALREMVKEVSEGGDHLLTQSLFRKKKVAG
jgi:uncharacterized protein YtpQ (UPF0354 family)